MSEDNKNINSTAVTADRTADDDYKFSMDRLLRQSEIMSKQYSDSIILTTMLLIGAFGLGYGYGLDSNIRYAYTALAANAYSAHSLLSTINVINSVIGAASQIFYARLSDIFGRLELFISAVIFYVVGTIIQSQATDIQKYCAGAVFYNLGFVGVLLVLLLILSDISSLRWRLFYQFVPTLPYIINTWVSGTVSSRYSNNWSWGIGMWAFIFPLTCVPFICCLIHMRYLASKTDEWKALKQEKTFFQKHGLMKTLYELFWRLDVFGLIIMTVSLGCILVPLTLAGGLKSKWQDGKIIGPLVLGIVLIPVWCLYEAKFAKFPIAPYALVKDRGVWSALALSFLLDFVYYMAADYMYTVLIIAMNQSYASANRISTLYSFVSCVWAPFFALIVYFTKRLKVFIFTGVCLWMLACGLFFHFRSGEYSKPGVIAAYVCWGIGSGMFTYPVAVSVQASTSHEHLATVTALCYVLYRVGSAVGNSVSGAIWTQILPTQLIKHMGNETLAAEAYASPYTFILTHTWGTPIREDMVRAYQYVQKLETLVALVFCSLLIFFSLFLRDNELTNEVAHNNLGEDEMIYKKEGDNIFTFLNIFKNKYDVENQKTTTVSTNEDESEIEKKTSELDSK
ncbi:hypothetical protein WICPIJ_002441 [Wickerhamomyces pijperi]|uniref:Siderophore iron transporter ARN1 n=1 Tax=Wickerhamomyces pijperi TaxID=599730 RepID=A0A9P8Q908_WICPI|nr:hypothetical protein WICPIJ_002441 [Wickerhamomyces pijperi]